MKLFSCEAGLEHWLLSLFDQTEELKHTVCCAGTIAVLVKPFERS